MSEFSVSGDLGFILSSGDIYSINLSDKTNPNIIGFRNTNVMKDLIFEGDFLYVTDFIGLDIYDITNLSNLVVLDSYNSATEIGSNSIITKSGDYVYVASEGDFTLMLSVFDVSNSLDIIYVSSPTLFVPNGHIFDIIVDGEILYLYYGETLFGFPPSYTNKISVFNISDVNSISLISTFTISTGTAYSNDDELKLDSINEILYFGGEISPCASPCTMDLIGIDVSDSSNLSIVSNYNFYEHTSTFDVFDSVVFNLGGVNDLSPILVSVNNVNLGGYLINDTFSDVSVSGNPISTYLFGDYLYIFSTGGEFTIFDVSEYVTFVPAPPVPTHGNSSGVVSTSLPSFGFFSGLISLVIVVVFGLFF